ncbi:hypothetical protein WOLCODRAFT_143319 [Wolfiporia cocos MD-104 SS10]|uniref:Uncharacterized protein n=1 Tax=Wolfiporia cocos (strain MD-104) TaxID=742152 RepID=A0A2H3JFH5_WOLCO|nr:hypothetical protein WOLCODRAFT_143319 [Wolfiporia cocos MD-104 SS10]
MALQPPLRPLIIAGSPHAPHNPDIFSSPPHSTASLLPMLALAGGPYDGKVEVIFRPQVQPWHASSTLVHEAEFAVARVAPKSFWEFSLAFSKRQGEYFDISTSTQTPLQIRANLAALAAKTIGAGPAGAFAELLTP